MFLETILQDLRIGLRVLAKEKSFCALAVFVLALGICGVTTQFAVVNGVLLRGFSFPHPEQLMDVNLADPTDFQPNNFHAQVTTADFAELRSLQKSFSAFTAYLDGSTVNLTNNGVPQRLTGAYISWDFFRALGVAPVLGRDFTPEDDRPGLDKAVILTDALWRREFSADAGVIGKPVRVNGTAATIVGVMAPRFSFPGNEQLWIPVNTAFPPKNRGDQNSQTVNVIARLRPAVSTEQANAEMTALAKQFAKAYPDSNTQFSLGYVRPLIKSFSGQQLPGLLVTMLGFCVGVLLIACVNVMNMQFARATLRAKELAIRSSLGAGRARLIRQMLTESLLVAALGAIVGVALAYWTVDLLSATIANLTNPFPAWMSFTIDAPVLFFVVGATMLSALVSGFVPAWLSSRASATEVLKESGRGNTGRTIGIISKGLVVFQILITCLLLIGSLLQLQSIIKQQNVDFGYDTAGIISARVGLMEGDYPTNESRRLFYDKVLRELRANPEFEAVALTSRFQMVFTGGGPVEIEGKQYTTNSDRTNAQFENVSAGYHTVLGQKLIEGRYITDEDSDQKQPIAVVNASFAKKHFGHASAIGRRLRTVNSDGSQAGSWRTIVGVVTDVRMRGPFGNSNDNAGFYVPFFASPFGPVAKEAVAQQFGTLVAKPRGGGRGETAAQGVRNTVKRVDANLPPYFVDTPKTRIDGILGRQRVTAIMFAIFGSVAVILASVGLYGVTSFTVNQRTQEFGIRMALGADASTILCMVLKQGSWQIGAGMVLGLGLTLAIAIFVRQGIENILFGITATDPLTYFAVAALLATVSLLATFIPARRATRVDPMIALRAE